MSNMRAYKHASLPTMRAYDHATCQAYMPAKYAIK